MVAKSQLLNVYNEIVSHTFKSALKDQVPQGSKSSNFNLKTLVYVCLDVFSYDVLEKEVSVKLRMESNLPIELKGDSKKLRTIFVGLLKYA